MPELRQAAASPHHDALDRLQGIGLVQDGQPCGFAGGEGPQEGGEGRGSQRGAGGGAGGEDAGEGIGRPERGGLLTAAARSVALPTRVVGSFFADECPFLAGALAYQIFFALVPLLALVVGALGFVYGDEASSAQLVRLMREVYPSATDQEVRIIRELVEGRALSLGLGLLGTILGATAIYGSLDSGVAAVLGGGRARSFLRQLRAALVFVGALAVIAGASFALSYGAAAAQDLLRAIGLSEPARIAIGLLGPLVGLAAGYVFFLVVYRTVPRTPVPARDARGAALVSALLWEVAKLAFGLFTRSIGAFAVYGPLAFAAGLLTWIYLTGAIILLGTEVLKARRWKG